jgi:hypothetical protein
MYEGPPQDGAETEYRRRRREPPVIRRPDRIALWAVGMAVVAMVAAAASAHAGPGGTTRVIDRGPDTMGLRWDLSERAAQKLRLTYTDDVRAAPIRK